MSQFKPIAHMVPSPPHEKAALERLMVLLASRVCFSDERVEILERALRDIELILEGKGEPPRSIQESQTRFVAMEVAGDTPSFAPAGTTIMGPRQRDFDALSARERQIIEYLCRGEASKAIAAELGLAEATVNVHIKTLLRKLGLNNRTQVALCAMQQGWVRLRM